MSNSWFTDLESFFTTTEADVLGIIAKIKADEEIVIADIHNALRWVANNGPTIAQDIQAVLGVVEALGVVNPQLELAIQAANAAVVALNAFAAAEKAGKSDVNSVINGYVAVKQAQTAVAAAGVAAATAKKPNATAVPAVAAAA